MRRWLFCALAVLAISACAPQRVRPLADVAVGERLLSEHESRVFERVDFDLSGRIAISDGKQGGSGRFEWQQRGSSFSLRFTAPISAQNWRLEVRPGQAVLIESNGAVRVANSAEELLERELGWRLPAAALRFWVLGMRAPGSSSELQFDPHGQLHTLHQSGWDIRYLERQLDQDPPMPRKLFARSGDHQVRMSIRRWNFDPNTSIE